MEYLIGQDIDNMSKEDLLNLVKGFYQKCIKNIGYEGLTIGSIIILIKQTMMK